MSDIAIVANGKRRAARAGATVADLLENIGLPAQQVLVERNGEPLSRVGFSSTALRDGDVLEIVQMVGGG